MRRPIRVAVALAALLLCAASGAPLPGPAPDDSDVTQSRRSSTSLAGDFFTVVHLSDTQYYSEKHPEIFAKVTAWIAQNAARERIAFVTHTGDVVQSGANEPGEWDAADRAMSALDGAGSAAAVPWGVAPGNHDYDVVSGKVSAATEFIRRFGPARFRNAPWYGGFSGNGLNSYQLISHGGTKLLILHLEADPPDAALSWAEAALKRHPALPAILATHIWLDDVKQARGRSAYFRKGGNGAEKIWETFVKTHPQIFMVLSGHWAKETGEYHQSSVNSAGKKVHELLADFQRRPQGGDGLVRLIRFFPAKKTIEVRTFSVTRNAFEEGPASRFDLPWE